MPEKKTADQAAHEADLVRRAQTGEAEAMAEIYRLHAPAVFRYFLFRVQDHQTAEDLTGDLFLKVVEALPRYVDRGLPFAAWLFRIAHDRTVDHHRRAAHRATDPLDDETPDGTDELDTEGQALRQLDARRLQALMGELTEEQRLVIQMRFVEGYSLEETATIMGKRAGAIKALQHRALRQLARRWSR